jgi:protein-tyrosine phosphatase
MVCTGNICRSPMAEWLLRAHLEERGAEANVHSAGTLQWEGAPPAQAVAAMQERGIDMSAHRSRALRASLIADADLVLCMTRNHLWAVTTHDPGAAERTFLVGELVRLGAKVGPREPGESVREWAARAAAARPTGAGTVGLATDEVPDPLGEADSVFRSTAERLDADLRALADLLAPADDRQ